ncbi:NAD-dependent epimerase/dehydratase family protein [Nonomuraea sp. NPDC050691]|uniref:NAD-dependent epimerase/dehydratase family protein n=1 Tax=Nonomuraea sp. NPDC050691 TaxID=3155661 RepID=UPI00340A50A0
MNVLVIGATGYIGSAVAAALTRAGHDVAALRRPGGSAPAEGLGTVAGDLTDPASLTLAAKGFDRVVHAGPPLGERADLAAVDALLAAGSPLLHTTGAAVLGGGAVDEESAPDPHPLVSWRAEAERRVLAAGGQVVRPGLVYGDGGGLVPGLLAAKAAERGAGVYIGEPGVRWPVVHVRDLAELYVAVLARGVPGAVWHGVSETVRLDAIAAALGGGRAVSWPLDEARAELGPLADLFTRDQDVSSGRTRRALGWSPAHTSMIEELRR